VRLSISGAPVDDSEGRIIGGVLIVRDVTERRQLEIALSEANRRMDEFLGVASHELRTPLTSIKGNVQLAKRQLRNLLQPNDTPVGASMERSGARINPSRPGEDVKTVGNEALPLLLRNQPTERNVSPQRSEAERISILQPSSPAPIDLPNVGTEVAARLELVQGLLDRAERQIQLLNRLVGDLLDVSRIQANKLELRLETCDLANIVREAVEDQQQMAPARLIRLELPAKEVHVIADPGSIGQVVTNYLSNALKYSVSDQPIDVTLRVEEQTARLSVHDEGPGLSTSEQERVWERFYRVPDIEVKSGSGVGLGLGLYISKTIVERHHGYVGVYSNPGKGATFWFTMPLASPTSIESE